MNATTKTSSPRLVDERGIDSRLRVLTSVIQMQTELDAATTLADCASQICDTIAEQFSASCVLLAWRPVEGKPLQILASAERHQSTENSRLQQFAHAACEEIAAREVTAIFPPIDPMNRYSLLAVCQYARAVDATCVMGASLVVGGVSMGALLVIADESDPTSVALLDVLRFPIASKLGAIARTQPRAWETAIRGIASSVSHSRIRWAMVAIAIVAVVMCIPVPYEIRCNCELQPLNRRIVASPIDGPLEKTYVRPGDRVEKGDLIATIDSRELDFKIAGLDAEFKRAEQQRNRQVASHEFAESKIAELETERVRLERAMAEHQRNELEIRSPISGFVVSGDHYDSVGTPLKMGESLFEIAPLGKMVVEAAVDERDFSHVRKQMTVSVMLFALPHQRLTATIDHLHPEAEVRDHQNSFIAEAIVADPSFLLRPGMRGHAWIKSDRKSLGWILFHRAAAMLQAWMGW